MAKGFSDNLGWVKTLVVLLLVFCVVLAIGLFYSWSKLTALRTQIANLPNSNMPNIISTSYNCDGGKTIQAQLFNNTAELNLSGGRSLLLMQGISASGVRYTNSDESITFWNKGNTAFLEEEPDQNVTYANCVGAGN